MTAPSADELAASTLLASLFPDELRDAAQRFTIRRYPNDAILVTEGDRLDAFCIVYSGRGGFFWRDDDGRQVDVAVVGPGEDFAAQSFGGEPMLTSVIAIEDLRLAATPIERLPRDPSASLASELLRHGRRRQVLCAHAVSRHVQGRALDAQASYFQRSAPAASGRVGTMRVVHLPRLDR